VAGRGKPYPAMAEIASFEDLRRLLGQGYAYWASSFPDHRGFAYTCLHSPIELLHAAGLTPVRLLHVPPSAHLSGSLVPACTCALARGATERMLSGDLACLDGVLFCDSCDAMKCLSDVWRLSGRRMPIFTLSLPRVQDAQGAQDYYEQVLRELAKSLESHVGRPIGLEALRDSVALYNQQRRQLRTMHRDRRGLTAEELWLVTMAAHLVPVDIHLQLMSSLWQRPEAQTGPARRRPALLLLGVLTADLSVVRLVEDLGGAIVADDLCVGSRYLEGWVDEAEDPFASLAERHLRTASCPSIHITRGSRVDRLLKLVKESEADGVVFLLPKFCESHAFDYALLSDALERASIAHTRVETDLSSPLEQTRTRIQAFIEMLA